MSAKLDVVILAAGKGTRMYSKTPKVLHELAGRSMVEHVIDRALELDPRSITLVLGHEAELIEKQLGHYDLKYALQQEQKGTAHAVEQALPYLDDEAMALVLYGDVPMIEAQSLQKLLASTDKDSMAVLTCVMNDPSGLGRILRDEKGKVKAIVEEKDASAEQKLIAEINTGIMAFPVKRLKAWLPLIKNNNAQNEYYLTDIIELALADGAAVNSQSCNSETEASGVNNMVQLATLERAYQQNKARELMLKGVSLRDPKRFDCRGDIDIAGDVKIDINVILEGKVIIEEDVVIGPNCVLKNCTLKKGTQVMANSVIEDAEIGQHCSIGPFARIRPGTLLEDEAKIGNFVETKKAHIGSGSKVNHLSYIGDTELGKGVNIGAGSITCNYDGVNKFKTIIGDNVFIGSNSALVAPVTVAQGATVGAGSTITKDVASGELALSRVKQSNIKGWKRPTKK